MEASGAILRRSPWCGAAESLLRRNSGEISPRPGRVSMRSRRNIGGSGVLFSNEEHLRYYASPARCGGGEKKGMEKEAKKRREKLVKSLSRDLAKLHAMGGLGMAGPVEIAGGVGPVLDVKEGKISISEAANVIMAQLELLRAGEKEMKRKRKEEKPTMKVAWPMMEDSTKCNDEESSSSSSESSDSDCEEEAVCMSSQMRTSPVEDIKMGGQTTLVEASSYPGTDEPTLEYRTDNVTGSRSLMKLGQDCSNNMGSCRDEVNGVVLAASASAENTEKIEVCMGGKCKKSGALELMREFERQIGAGGVVGCKCMGKCRDGPNVRVLKNHCEVVESPVEIVRNPLCIGVGLEDVGTIVADFFGEKKGMGLLAA